MKKKVLAGLLASMSLFGVCFSGVGAFADEVDSQDTQVGIGFTAHDPGTGTGDLKLLWVPHKLDFKDNNIVNTVAHDFPEVTNNSKYVVVSDQRAKTAGNKWELKAAMSDIMDGTTKLTGATLGFSAAAVGYTDPTGALSPESTGAIEALGSRTATVASGTQSIAQNPTASLVMSDVDATGSYVGETALEMTNIKLNVPANAAVSGAQYTGTLTWSLDDTL